MKLIALINGELFMFIGFIAVCAVVFFLSYYFSSAQVVLRKLRKLPKNRIGSLRTDAFSKIDGKALNINEPLIAPLSKRKCVFYKMKIEKRVKSGKSSRWKTVVNEERIQDFFLEKGSERIMVLPTTNPKNYLAHLVTDKTSNSGSFKDPSPEFKTLLNFYGIESEGVFGFNKQLRYTEGIIEIGELITVAGNVKWMDLEEPIGEYSYNRIASLSAGRGKDKLIITDHPKAQTKQGRL